MKDLPIVLRIGSRRSRLALVQAREAVSEIARWLPTVSAEVVPMSSPGDRDRQADLQTCPPDFFTRDLDQAVLDGTVDCAIHSAKDLPDPVAEGLDWFWTPGGSDPRDALVLPTGMASDMAPRPLRVGVSSARRTIYVRQRFPQATILPVRGNIEDRLRQLDEGAFDAIIMAGAALLRLGLPGRITEWIPLQQLPSPDGQGRLAMTFRTHDPIMSRLRSLFVRPVVFVGAGPGGAGLCTVAGKQELEHGDVCLHDALVHADILEWLPKEARRIFVGKRGGRESIGQKAICALLARYCRRGLRVVRLKGGDPGIFGRLAEEIETLDNLRLPHRVVPGISSLCSATTGTGLLQTRRGLARGFSALTPRKAGGGLAPIDSEARSRLPLALFMARSALPETVADLLRNGQRPHTCASLVFNSGCDDEWIVAGHLDDILQKWANARAQREELAESPALFLVGDMASDRFIYRQWGAFQGARILLTCSSVLLERAARSVLSFGGRPVLRPMIRLTPEDSAVEIMADLAAYDWIVLTSPSAVDSLIALMDKIGQDARTLPRILVGGPMTAARIRDHRIIPDAAPESEYGVAVLQKLVAKALPPGSRVVRFRSDRADQSLTKTLRGLGHHVQDCVLYRNEAIKYARQPRFDAAFFASASAVTSAAGNWGMDAFTDKDVAVIGEPTARALRRNGVTPAIMAAQSTVENTIAMLAGMYAQKAMASARASMKTSEPVSETKQ